MNNYCTNCGEKLNNGEAKCSKCNVPIIEIAKQKNPNKKLKKYICLILIIIIGILSLYILIDFLITKYEHKKFDYEIIENLEQKYNNKIIRFEVIDKYHCYECYPGLLDGCDGTDVYNCVGKKLGCTNYKYEVTFNNNQTYNIYVFKGRKILEYKENIRTQKLLLNYVKKLNNTIKLGNYNTTFEIDEVYSSDEYDVEDNRHSYSYDYIDEAEIKINLDIKSNFSDIISEDYFSSLTDFFDKVEDNIIISLNYKDGIYVKLYKNYYKEISVGGENIYNSFNYDNKNEYVNEYYTWYKNILEKY